MAVDELLVRRGSGARAGCPWQPGRPGGVVELARVVGRGVHGLEARDASASRRSSRISTSSTRAGSIRSTLSASVTSTLACESSIRWRIPSSPYRTDIDRRIAPAFHVPKKAAAVSGVAGSSIATRSPRSTPWARSTLANCAAMSCISPQLTPPLVPAPVLPDHRELVARVLVADVRGDVVALGHVPAVLSAGLLVAGHGQGRHDPETTVSYAPLPDPWLPPAPTSTRCISTSRRAARSAAPSASRRATAGCICACVWSAARSAAATPLRTSTPAATRPRTTTRSWPRSSPARTGAGATRTSSRSSWRGTPLRRTQLGRRQA